MNKALRRLAGALQRAQEPIIIDTKRGIERAVQAVDVGLCRFTREVTRHSVIDPAWHVSFGIELTDDGKKVATA